VTVSVQQINQQLRALPLEEKTWLLICAVIEQNSEALAAAHAVVKLAHQMAKGLSAENRANVAEALRDTADLLDAGLEMRCVWRPVT